MFLAPGHFHAALTLRERNPLLSDEIAVYTADEAEIREFLDLVERFNARPEVTVFELQDEPTKAV